MAFYQYRAEQDLQVSLDELWDFISDPRNLSQITPQRMGFKITSPNIPEKMYEGLIISYKVKPVANIPTTWVTEITKVKDKTYFVDEQRIGPFKMWHHEHILEVLNPTTIRMKDIVSYAPPLGILGRLANFLFIKSNLKQIFEHRKTVLAKKFSS